MARRNVEPSQIFVRDYLAGLNTRSFPNRIADNQVSSGVLNTELSENGVLGKRKGVNFYGTVGSLASTSYCGGLGTFYTSTGKELLADFGPYLTRLSSSRFTPISGATFTVGYDKNFVMARGNIYVHNGIDMMTKYNGTALSRSTAATTGASAGASVAAGGVVTAFGMFFKTSHLAGGSPVFPNRLFVSEAGDSSKFILDNLDGNSADQAQWYDVSKDDGDQLTGMAYLGDTTVLAKDRAIYQGNYNTAVSAQSGALSGTTNFFTSILPINKGIGCSAHRTLDQMENDLVFLSRSGPAVYTLGLQPNLTGLRLAEISQPVRDQLEQIAQANISKAAGLYHNKKYYLAYPAGTSTYNNRVLVFNREYGVWEGVYEGLNVNSLTSFIDPDNANTETLLMADGNSRRVGEMLYSSYTDFSSAINCDVFYKNFDLDTPGLYKRWKDVTLFFRDTVGSITVSIYIDGVLKKVRTFDVGTQTTSVGIGSGLIGAQLIGDAGGGVGATTTTTVDRRIKINKKGRTCQIRIQNNTANETFSLHSMQLTYRSSYGHGAYPTANKIT